MAQNERWFSEVLKALADAYDSNYPWSRSVKDGLRCLLRDRYRDNSEEFKEKFVHPTLSLLGRLKEEDINFPLCLRDGQVVLHLVPPEGRLFIGEFYYQVGRTRPGSLAVKFAKYRDNRGSSVIQQPSEIDEADYDIAFTAEYFADVRSKAEGVGDVLLRTLVVLSAPDWTVGKTDAAKHLKNCPAHRTGRLRSDSHLSVQESGDDESSESIEPNSPCENMEHSAISEDDSFTFD